MRTTRIMLILLSLIASGLWTEPLAGSMTVMDQLSNWRQEAETISAEKARAFAQEIKKNGTSGDVALLSGLLDLVESKRSNMHSRRLALETACGLIDESSAKLVVDSLVGLTTEFPAASAQKASSEQEDETWKNKDLLRFFVDCCARDLMDSMGDQKPLVELLAQMGLDHYDWAARTRYRLIAYNNLSLVVRRQLVIGMITEYPVADAPPVLMDILTENDFPSLRKLVDFDKNTKRFHWTAAWVLSHLGDKGILTDLKRYREQSASAGVPSAKRINRLIWRIEIQNPPTKLLEQIKNADSQIFEGPDWFINRAVKLLPREDVRKAVLQYLNKYSGAIAITPFLKATIITGVDTGVITENDLKAARIPFEQLNRWKP